MDYRSYEHYRYLKHIREILEEAMEENFVDSKYLQEWPERSFTYRCMEQYRLENLFGPIRSSSHEELIRLHSLPDDELANEITAMAIEHLGE